MKTSNLIFLVAILFAGCAGTKTLGDITISKKAYKQLQQYEWVQDDKHDRKKVQEGALELFYEIQGQYKGADFRDLRDYLERLDGEDGLKDGCISGKGIENMRSKENKRRSEEQFRQLEREVQPKYKQ